MAEQERLLRNLSFPIQYLEIGESLIRSLKWDVDEFYRRCGVQQGKSRLPGQTIDGMQMKAALELFYGNCLPGQPPVVSFMAHFPLTANGALGMLAMTASTLEGALQGALDFLPLFVPAFAIRRQDHGDQVHIILERLYDFGSINAFFTELVVLALLKIGPFLSRALSAVTVNFTHQPSGALADYEAAFHGSFIFDSTQNSIVLARTDLGIPLLTPSPTSHELMKSSLLQQSRERPEGSPVSQRVRRLLQQALKDGRLADADTLAEALAMSPRTLSRRLHAEGSTLPQLQLDVSIDYAKLLLLESSKSISDIARQTGFLDGASFSRAFRRQVQKTPSQFRAGRPAG